MSAVKPIQGKNAILYFKLDETYVPYVCATDFAMNFSAQKKSIKTIGSGVYADYDYQSLEYSISLNGLLVYNTDVTGWDLLAYHQNFLKLPFKVTFTEGANIKSIIGTVMIESVQLNAAVNDVVKNAFTLPGCGSYFVFDGASPCDIVATNLTISQEAPGSVVEILVTESSPATQWKYSVDGGGDAYSSVNPFAIPDVIAPGSHSFKVTPICANDYEGTSFTKLYTVL